jgi:hypothetical protein
MPSRNPYVCLAIVVSLACVAIVGTGGLVWIGGSGREAPPALTAVVSAACGALAGALAMTPQIRRSDGEST